MSVIQESNNAYAAVTQVDGAVSEAEEQRLVQQAEVYSRLAGSTLDALGLAPGHRVLEVGCGGGSLLAAAAARVGPTGRVVGIDGDPRLVEAAKRRVAHLPWVDVVQADALGYEADESFDAVHCRRVLMHQHAPDVFLAHGRPDAARRACGSPGIRSGGPTLFSRIWVVRADDRRRSQGDQLRRF